MSTNSPLYHQFQQEFSHHYEPLCQYAFSFVKEIHAAEDIVQDIFVHVWEKKQSLVGNEGMRYYLFTAVRNNCLTWLQRNKRSVVTTLTGQEGLQTAPEEYRKEKTETDFHTLMQSALDKLPPKCREVFVLSRMSKLTYQEIADTQGISVKTVENQMGKALRILRNFIRERQAYLTVLLFSIFYSLIMIGVYARFML
ncbi:RNA polymerase sigma-70 factor [Pseudobacter ginsenosidimutans]|uniref:RNA polymerase sigma-70 factor (ECF subfamily) n=1 Tax=Pseudobacter ginsenosidimutans TaxID=661488 RepID=A0A4Q7N3W9_9BACT|nr:RNA polymerase sigma-70 factor [Pseudobacter ginsenosidimutans]QEC44217.1 RNA polymerase sigma-70 factor [Pseudobacter ginsenosidimutans]RZS75675.1 RNA polymerase sigma-70 factor (ECF subfamily) [Pseudobacter ginsenosidimutans]